MTKKLFLILVLTISIILPQLFAQNIHNNAHLVPLGSGLYEALDTLYYEHGRTVPFTNRPYTVDEYLMYLEPVELETTSKAGKTTLQWIHNELDIPLIMSEGNSALASNPIISPEFYLNSDKDIITDTGSQHYLYGNIYGYEERLPILSLPINFWAGKFFFIGIDIDIKQQPGLGVYPTLGEPATNNSNVPLGFDQIFHHFPDNYYLSYNTEHASGYLGSSEYSIGVGETGKLLLSQQADHIPAARMSWYNKHVRYNFTYLSLQTGFGNASSYTNSHYSAIDLDNLTTEYNHDIYGKDYEDYMSPGTYPYKGFLTHTMEFRFMNDQLYIGVSESAIYARAVPELSMMIPLTLWHNTNNGEQTNSLLSLDLQYSIHNWAQVYASGILDQFTMSHETDSTDPEAHGYLVGMKTAIPYNSGYFTGNIEYVYTNDWLYTHKYFLETHTVAQRNTAITRGGYDIRPLGYPLGNDVSLLHIEVGYETFGNYSITGIYNYIEKGPYDVFLSLPREDDDTIIDPTGERKTWPLSHYHTIGIEGSYDYENIVKAKALLYYTHADNYKNQLGDTFKNFEVTLSFSIDPVALSKKVF